MRALDNDAIFQASLVMNDLASLFECVNHQAQIIIGDGDTDTANYGVILECIAEKGIREANVALDWLDKIKKAKKENAAPAPVAKTSEGASNAH